MHFTYRVCCLSCPFSVFIVLLAEIAAFVEVELEPVGAAQVFVGDELEAVHIDCVVLLAAVDVEPQAFLRTGFRPVVGGGVAGEGFENLFLAGLGIEPVDELVVGSGFVPAGRS